MELRLLRELTADWGLLNWRQERIDELETRVVVAMHKTVYTGGKTSFSGMKE
jgi:hypothetical protein